MRADRQTSGFTRIELALVVRIASILVGASCALVEIPRRVERVTHESPVDESLADGCPSNEVESS